MKIIKYLLLLLFFTLFSPNLKAQIGIRLGANFASCDLSGDFEYKPATKVGVGAGIFYQDMLDENISIQPELNFMQMGTKYSADEGEEGSLLINYLHISVLAKYSFGDTQALHFYAQGGFYLGYGIGKATSEYCDNGDCDKEDLDFDSAGEEGPKPLDYGIQLGIGSMIDQNFSIDLRYFHGFQNITAVGEGSIKNYSIFVSGGYKF